MIEVRLLGGFSLVHEGSLIAGFGTPRLHSLLAHLLLQRGVPHARQQLAFLLWPDSTEDQARTNLRKLLYQLRHSLPEAERYLQLSGQEVKWVKDVPLILDVQEFEEAVQAAVQGREDEQAHLTRAVQRYQGDLLPGCYDEWLEPERERLRRQLANCLERLIAVQEGKRDIFAAIASAERLLQMDVLNESAHRHLMRLHSLAGDRAGALRAYQACAAVLKTELSVEPSAETRGLYARLLDGETYTPPAPVGSAAPRIRSLVGREREWAALQKAWGLAAEGHPRCILISGEAGIGKTRLAEEMLQWTMRQGFLSAAARCFASEGALAYAPVTDWLRAGALRKRWIGLESVWLAELARVMPEIHSDRPDLPRPERLGADWQRRRLFEALLRALCPAPSPVSVVPTVLLIDDLQWCDSETLAFLHYLLRSAIPAKLLLVGTLRTEEITPGHALESWLEDLRSSVQPDEVALGPLSAAETKTLAENEAGRGLEPDAAARLFAETEGHPLFVVESMRMAGDPSRAGEDWITAGESNRTSPTIHAVISWRLALLSPAARDLAGLAATIGHSFTYPVLVKASKETSEATLVRGLDELWQRRIIREHGMSAYDFSHDKIRAAAYQGLSTARRRYLHRCVAESLEDLARNHQAADPRNEVDELSGQIGSHFEKAGIPSRAIPYYLQAAEVARRVYANESALAYFQAALALLRDSAGRVIDPSLAAQIEEQAGDLLLLLTRRAEARAAFERGMQHLPPLEQVGRANLVLKMGNTLRDEYHFEDSLAVYARALKELGDPTGLEGDANQKWHQCWVQVQIEIQNVYYWLGWIEKSEALAQEMSPVVESFATFLQRAVFFSLMGMVRLRANRYVATDEIVAVSSRGLQASLNAGVPERIPAAHFGYGFVLLLHGDLDPAEAEIGAALQLAEQRGDLSLESRCLTYLTIIRRKKGDVSQALRLARKAQATTEAAKMPEYAGAARANLGWVALRVGDSAQAREHCLAALALWDQSTGVQAATTPYYWAAIWPLVRVCLDEGDLTGAFSYACRLLEPQRKGLPADLVAVLNQAVEKWDANHSQAAREALLSAAALAETLGEF